MKKYVPVLMASAVLLVSFQNCSQQSPGSDSTSAITQTKIDDPLLSQAKSLDILTSSDADKINLNLQTGELTQIGQSGMVKKCLSESLRGQIQDLLAHSNLCEFDEPAADMVCAQVYSPAYSEIHWADKSVVIGEAISSCQKNIDLCGQDGKVLRGLLRDVVARWDDWSCDFQVVQR